MTSSGGCHRLQTCQWDVRNCSRCSMEISCFKLRIAQAQAGQETIQLRLRQRKVPSWSIGFCVAIKRMGASNRN